MSLFVRIYLKLSMHVVFPYLKTVVDDGQANAVNCAFCLSSAFTENDIQKQLFHSAPIKKGCTSQCSQHLCFLLSITVYGCWYVVLCVFSCPSTNHGSYENFEEATIWYNNASMHFDCDLYLSSIDSEETFMFMLLTSFTENRFISHIYSIISGLGCSLEVSIMNRAFTKAVKRVCSLILVEKCLFLAS